MLPSIVDHVALDSISERNGLCYWKFDPAVSTLSEADFGAAETDSLESMLDSLQCRTAYLRCEHGVVPPVMASRIKSIMRLRGPFVELPACEHHPMLDQP
jgi:pimeloyl-ACP methyl ester carboxylesterase